MIHTYIEKKLLRAIDVADLLLGKQYIPAVKISNKLNCTYQTTINDISYLKDELGIYVENDHYGGYRINPFTEGNQDTLNKQIYSHSLFLKSLIFFLVPSDQKFIDFIDDHFISVSKGYQLRGVVESFLTEIGLTLVDNQVVGDLVKIRFLASELNRQFNPQLLVFDSLITAKSMTILDDFEEQLSIQFSKTEREVFHSLIQTTVAKNLPTGELSFGGNADHSLGYYLYPKRFRESMEQQFRPVWNERFNQEYTFAVLALFLMNTHVFDEIIESKTLQAYRENFIQNPFVQELLKQFRKVFQHDYSKEDWFISSLFIFLKNSALGLQPLTSSGLAKNMQVDEAFFFKVKHTIDRWNVYDLTITDKHIHALCCRLSPFMVQKQTATIALVTENSFDRSITQKAIQQFLPQGIHYSSYTELTPEVVAKENSEETLFIIDKRAPLSRCNKGIKHSVFINFPPGPKELQKVITLTFI